MRLLRTLVRKGIMIIFLGPNGDYKRETLSQSATISPQLRLKILKEAAGQIRVLELWWGESH